MQQDVQKILDFYQNSGSDKGSSPKKKVSSGDAQAPRPPQTSKPTGREFFRRADRSSSRSINYRHPRNNAYSAAPRKNAASVSATKRGDCRGQKYENWSTLGPRCDHSSAAVTAAVAAEMLEPYGGEKSARSQWQQKRGLSAGNGFAEVYQRLIGASNARGDSTIHGGGGESGGRRTSGITMSDRSNDAFTICMNEDGAKREEEKHTSLSVHGAAVQGKVQCSFLGEPRPPPPRGGGISTSHKSSKSAQIRMRKYRRSNEVFSAVGVASSNRNR